MDYDLVVKIATVCIGLVGAAKGLYDLSIGRRSKSREEYKFAKEFLEFSNENKNIHPYLRDKGYQAIAGDNAITGEEVEYLLSLTRPERALKDYVMGKKYIEHLPNHGNLQIKFKEKYKSKWSRRWRMYAYLLLYIAFAFAAFSPLLFSSYFHMDLKGALIAFIISLAVFAPYAYIFLMSGAKIYRAQMLVEHQNKHTQRIILPSMV
ncbi:hypothetical protein LK542_24515 [Massilia sp. IC2-477]|uniref:hypothetical protein n=1 Tax=Massilia sp. IC2-477 TaxID=2887198 RepID=UPI001D0F6D71|nr:hypothetical protein [Massilia sp. IC2-477]MCC2958779.1 hypothetical protein [Massilia sp. IC2-477]